jgi:hypothetical protein
MQRSLRLRIDKATVLLQCSPPSTVQAYLKGSIRQEDVNVVVVQLQILKLMSFVGPNVPIVSYTISIRASSAAGKTMSYVTSKHSC